MSDWIDEITTKTAHLLAEAYNQGRIDAIDRCVEIVRDGCYRDVEMLIEFLEKEQKNE